MCNQRHVNQSQHFNFILHMLTHDRSSISTDTHSALSPTHLHTQMVPSNTRITTAVTQNTHRFVFLTSRLEKDQACLILALRTHEREKITHTDTAASFNDSNYVSAPPPTSCLTDHLNHSFCDD